MISLSGFGTTHYHQTSTCRESANLGRGRKGMTCSVKTSARRLRVRHDGSVVTKKADACMIQDSQADASVGKHRGETFDTRVELGGDPSWFSDACPLVGRSLIVWRGMARGTILSK